MRPRNWRAKVFRHRAMLTTLCGVLFGAVFLFVGRPWSSDDGGARACAVATTFAERLKPLVHGEIAALQMASTPRRLTDLAFSRADGTPITLASFQGSVVLLNVWATWCAPCRIEMPALDRLQSELGGSAFSVVPVSIDTGEASRPADFLKGIGADHLQLYTDRSTEIFQELKKRSLALGLPVSVLIDRNGCYLGHMNGPAEWDSAEGKQLIAAVLEGT